MKNDSKKNTDEPTISERLKDLIGELIDEFGGIFILFGSLVIMAIIFKLLEYIHNF